MRTARLITAAIAAAALAAAGPAAAGQVHHLTARDAVARPIPRPPTSPLHPQPITQIATLPDGRPIPQPPTWPLHPQPVTQIATLPDGRPIPQPPTWPLHPHVIPPPDTVAQLPAIADRPGQRLRLGLGLRRRRDDASLPSLLPSQARCSYAAGASPASAPDHPTP